ncbi:MAG: PKD domain-containing protein [Ferruginibacter sp.]
MLWILITLIPSGLFAQNKSNKGREFWLGYGHNVLFTQGSPVNSQELVLYLSAQQAATVTVTINSTGFSQTVNIPANSVDFSVIIPKSGVNDARIMAEGLSTKGIHILSDVPIVVYAHQYGLFSSGATMLMPVETYGFTYYSINYIQESNYPDSHSWFYVVASEDNTRLQITPSDSTEGGWEPNLTYTVNLNKGEIYNVFGKKDGNYTGKDMTGSKVVSIPGGDGNCHPVALFSGSSRIIFCSTGGGEIMQQQVFPAQAWGTQYLTHHTLNNTNTNINATFNNFYRICVQDPTTIVKRNGVVMTGLINNLFYELMDSTGGDYYTADKPIMVAQFTPNKNQCWGANPNPYGDPEMFYLSPVEQGQKNVLFYTSSNFGIDYIYCNITVPTSGITSLRVDGLPLPATQIKPHPNNPAYSVAFANLTNISMQHSIISDSAFTGIVYGLGFLESYGYNIGTNINNLNAIGSIKNTNSTSSTTDSFTCKITPFRVTIKTAYPLTNIHWKLSQVVNMTPNTDSIIASPVPVATEIINFRTYYTYTLQQDFTITTPGTYYLPVTYTSPNIDNCSNEETSNIEIIVLQGPVADFTYAAATCLGDTIFFTGAAVPAPYNIINYLWNFDDATTQSTQNASKLFATAGIQNVRYRVYADNGCVGDTIKAIVINPNPTAVFGVMPTSCAGDSVLISDTSTIATGTITNWRYDFGDGNTLVRSTNSNFYHGYALPGTYTISLVTVSNNGCLSDTALKPVNVFAKPVSLFGANANICVGDSVLVTDTSSISIGSINSWRYDFGDGNTLVRTNSSPFYHTYGNAGTFSISLVTVSDIGCVSDTFRKTVVVSPKPTADFSINAVNCLRDTVFFNHIVPPGSFNIVGYLWDFDDATTQITIDAKKKFLTPGVQNIRYRITSDMGCIGDTTKSIIISPDPVALIGVVALGCSNDPVQISDTSSVSSGTIASWQYDFGDGNTLTRNVNTPFTHTYISAGTYQLTLTTFSALGCNSDTAKKTIVISDKPVAGFSFTGTPCVGNTFTFTSSYTNTTGTSWYWDFGDGQTLTTAGNTVTHVYTNAQTNIVVKHVVSITGSICLADTSFNTIPVIHQNPVAAFGILKDTACENIPLQFLSATAGINTWNWNFGNGTGTNAPPFNRTYSTAGTYNVSLSVTDNNNCSSLQVTDVLVVNPQPVVDAGTDKLINFGATVLLNASVTPASSYSYLWTPSVGLSANNILQPVASPQTNTTYILKVEDVNSHCMAVDDVFVKIVPDVHIPNAFTPNGDGKNDQWNIPALAQYSNAVVIIFNRYGQKIVEARNYSNNPWDGSFKGKPQPNGSYVYHINLNDNRNQVFQGTVTVIR